MKTLVSIIILSVPLLLLKAWAEDATWERSFELQTYHDFSVLRNRFRPQQSHPVIVVDLSELPARSAGPNTEPVTPRDDLRKLIVSLDAAGAAAIGLDIDFSPDGGLYVDQADPQFFEWCLERSAPVFLGVARQAGAPEEAWLGDRRFSKMAAAIVVPNEHDQLTEQGVANPYPTRIPIIRRADAYGEKGVGLRSMGMALASVVQPDIERVLAETGFMLRSRGKKPEPKLEVWEFTLDERNLSDLKNDRRTLRASSAGFIVCAERESSPCASGLKDMNGAIVLVGDTKAPEKRTEDEADVFLHDGAPWRGVYYHASAALTLLDGPLRVFTAPGRVVMDLLAACIPSLLLMVRRQNKNSPDWKLMGFIGTMGVVSLGAFVLLEFRVLWLDWVLVLLAVALHLLYEDPMLKLLRWVSRERKG